MKKGIKIFLCLVLVFIIVAGGVDALAYDEDRGLAVGQVIDGDYMITGVDMLNEGIILGDFICAGQSVTSTGTVEGDLIAAVGSAQILGDIQGSVRVASNNIKISALIGRNLMIAGNNVFLDKGSAIGRNAYLYGTVITCEGIVKGDLSLVGADITLSGTYDGNVQVKDMGGRNAKFQLLPGATIKGKLTYTGTENYVLPSGVSVGEYEFIQVEPSASETAMPRFTTGKVIKTCITMLIYFLFALLIYKMFPSFSAQSGRIIRTEPVSVGGVGIATFGSLVGGAILLLLLLLIIVFIANLSVFGYILAIFFIILIITALLSMIPVSIWLGNTVLKKESSIPGSLATGIAIITVVRLALEFLKTINTISGVAGIILTIVNATIWVFGVGAVIKTIFAIVKAANSYAEEQLAQEFSQDQPGETFSAD